MSDVFDQVTESKDGGDVFDKVAPAGGDVFDSLTSKRVYRTDDFSPNEAFKIIEQSVGLQFDPTVFAAFKVAWPDIIAEQERLCRLDASRRESAERQSLGILT